MSDASFDALRHSPEDVSEALEGRGRSGRAVNLILVVSALLTLVFVVSIVALFVSGVGIWGIAIPVAWGTAIVNFVWWTGLAHGATLISATLLMMGRNWRSALARAAETLALVALACGAIFPLLHLGRPAVFYWMVPYPNTMALWPQFRSALEWDVFAALCYGGAAFLFWYVPLIPDLATMRDRSERRGPARLLGILALGWRGAGTHWARQEYAYRVIGGIALALIFSFHTITGFATTLVPGWHSTLLPPFFLAGAVLSGAAALLVFVILLRQMRGMERFITRRHIHALAGIILAASLAVGYGHVAEYAINSTGGVFTGFVMLSRIAGANAHVFWFVILTTVLVPQIFWSRRMRYHRNAQLFVGSAVLLGVWADRFILVVTPLQRGYLPSAWEVFNPTIWDATTLLGSVGLFLLGLTLATRLLPIISVAELKAQLHVDGRLSGSTELSPPEQQEGDRDYGILAEFASAPDLVDAARDAWVRGHRDIETFTPFPVAELRGLLPVRCWLIGVAATAGFLGATLLGYGMQYYASVISYPLNVGGRPLHSWPAFVPIALETGLFGAALGAFAAMLILNRLPALHHPLFAVPGFERATIDRFFLFIPSGRRGLDGSSVRSWLQRRTSLAVRSVRW